MNGYILDTNVISETIKPKPTRSVLTFIEKQTLQTLFISSVTLAEIRYGIERQPDPNRRGQLNDWLTHRVRPLFEGRILPVSEDVMFRWRLLVEEGRKANHTFSQPDLIIGATALQFGLTLVTRNTVDFERTRVVVHNPWTA